VLCRDGCFSLGLHDLQTAVVDEPAAVLGALSYVVNELVETNIRIERLVRQTDSDRSHLTEQNDGLRSKLEEFRKWQCAVTEKISDLETGLAADAKSQYKLMKLRITEVFQDARICRSLEPYQITTLGDLLKCSSVDLLKVRNLGKKSVVKIQERLKSMGLSLRAD
jgi:DNA-directed RNA polymerase subunit alpha